MGTAYMSVPPGNGNQVKWFTPDAGKGKFYQGSPTQTVWNQTIHRGAMNDSENKYLMAIASGEHSSQKVLGGREGLGPVPNMDMGGSSRSQRSHRSSGSNMSGVINDLKGFNGSIRGEIEHLKGYLAETNAKLEALSTRRSGTHRSSRRSARSHTSQGFVDQAGATGELYSVRSSHRSDQPPGSAAGAVADARKEVLMEALALTLPPNDGTDPKRSSRFKGYKIGHEVAMTPNGRYPAMGQGHPGAITKSHTARRQNMIDKVKRDPIVPEDSGHGKKLSVNNTWLDDPNCDSRKWSGMFRHSLATFQNRHDCAIPYHPV